MVSGQHEATCYWTTHRQTNTWTVNSGTSHMSTSILPSSTVYKHVHNRTAHYIRTNNITVYLILTCRSLIVSCFYVNKCARYCIMIRVKNYYTGIKRSAHRKVLFNNHKISALPSYLGMLAQSYRTNQTRMWANAHVYQCSTSQSHASSISDSGDGFVKEAYPKNAPLESSTKSLAIIW